MFHRHETRRQHCAQELVKTPIARMTTEQRNKFVKLLSEIENERAIVTTYYHGDNPDEVEFTSFKFPDTNWYKITDAAIEAAFGATGRRTGELEMLVGKCAEDNYKKRRMEE